MATTDGIMLMGSPTFTGQGAFDKTYKTYGGGPTSQIAQQIQAAQAPQYAPLNLPPAPNPMAGIPAMYTQQAPQNSLAPMAMYQAYKSGQMPSGSTAGQPAMGAK